MAVLDHCVEVVVDVAAEIRGIVGVDGHNQATRQHRSERMLFEVVYDTQAKIGEGAHGKGRLFVDEPGDQPIILETAVAMIDAVNAQEIQALCDIFGRTLLTSVSDEVEAIRTREIVQLDEEGGWVADLG